MQKKPPVLRKKQKRTRKVRGKFKRTTKSGYASYAKGRGRGKSRKAPLNVSTSPHVGGIERHEVKLGYDSARDCELDLNENYHKPRRSARISKKTQQVRNYSQQTASEYYYDCLQHSPAKETTRKSSRLVRNNSNSLFREINERCSKLKPKKPFEFNYPVSAVIDPRSKVERFHPSVFCVNLLQEVTLNWKSYDYLSNCKRTIAEKVRDLNHQLSGKMTSRHDTSEKTKQIDVDVDFNDFNYIPSSAWVFQTPPRQRVVIPKPPKSAIQPAVICTVNKRNNLYELHPNFHIDLTGVSGDGNVRPLVNFEEKAVPIRSFDSENFQEEYLGSHSTVSNLFAQVTCRPTKTVKTRSRTQKFYERRRGEGPDDTPTSANLLLSMEEFDRDVTFVEDNGTFKMVSSQASVNESFEFKFRRNLFNGGEEKMFNFDTEEPKMFNFAKLDGN